MTYHIEVTETRRWTLSVGEVSEDAALKYGLLCYNSAELGPPDTTDKEILAVRDKGEA